MVPRHEPEVLKSILLATTPDSDGDAEWFQANPGRMLRLRPASRAERRLSSGDAVFDPPLKADETGVFAVLVRQMGSGVRLRRSIYLRIPKGLTLDSIVESADEARCRRLWNSLTRKEGGQ